MEYKILLSMFVVFATCSETLGAVLDPALYLLPGPPLVPSSEDMTPAEKWEQKLEPRVERDAELLVLPLENKEISPSETEGAESMENSETFWIGFRPKSHGIYGLPISFSPSGTYGRYGGGSNTGYLADSYAFSNSMDPNSGVRSYGKGALAGSSYGSYGLGGFGTRVYGGNSGASWSGWGNGKWGHYGKG